MWESHDPKTMEPSNYQVYYDTCAVKILHGLIGSLSHLVKTLLNWWMILWRCQKITRHWKTCDNLRLLCVCFCGFVLCCGLHATYAETLCLGKKRAFPITMVVFSQVLHLQLFQRHLSNPPSKPLYELSFTNSINYFTPPNRYSKNIATPDSPICHD